MNLDQPKQTNYRFWLALLVIALLLSAALNVALLSNGAWGSYRESEYVKSARTAIQAVPALKAELGSNQVSLDSAKALLESSKADLEKTRSHAESNKVQLATFQKIFDNDKIVISNMSKQVSALVREVENLGTANTLLRTDYNNLSQQLKDSLEAEEKNILVRQQLKELGMQKDTTQCLEILTTLNEMTILFRGTKKLTLDQMPGRKLKCPFGGKYLMDDSLHVTCTHTNPSVAILQIVQP